MTRAFDPLEYTEEDYQRDIADPSCAHLQSREHFRAFYEMQGQSSIQLAQQVVDQRIDFIRPRGPRLIELGCHVGFNCVHFAQLGYQVVGVDVSAALLVEAERRRAQLPEPLRQNLRFVQGWIEDLQLDQPPFDDVILTEVLEHVIDPALIVHAAARWLAQGGTMWISAPNRRIGNYAHVRGVSEDALDGWLQAAGLTAHAWCSTGTETRAECRWA